MLVPLCAHGPQAPTRSMCEGGGPWGALEGPSARAHGEVLGALGTQETQGEPQEGPREGPRRGQEGPTGPKTLSVPGGARGPMGPDGGARGAQEANGARWGTEGPMGSPWLGLPKPPGLPLLPKRPPRRPKRPPGLPRRPQGGPCSRLHGIYKGLGMSPSRLYGIYKAPGARDATWMEKLNKSHRLGTHLRIPWTPGSPGSSGSGVRSRCSDPPFHAPGSQDDMSSQANSFK